MICGMEEAPVLLTDDDWLDLKDGAEAVLRHVVDSVSGRPGDQHVLTHGPDWSSMVVEVRDGDALELLQPWYGKPMDLPVVRGEDGLWTNVSRLKTAVTALKQKHLA